MSINKKIYISLSIVGVLTILAIFFMISPLLEKIKDNSSRLFSEKEKTAQLLQEKENLEKLEQSYNFRRSDLEKIETLLVKEDIPVEFIDFLEKTAADSNVQINISSLTKKTEKDDPWQNLFLKITANGLFADFLKFLEKLENSLYLIEVSDLNIKKTSEAEISTGVIADFSMKVFAK